jgi:hypothetical protein
MLLVVVPALRMFFLGGEGDHHAAAMDGPTPGLAPAE